METISPAEVLDESCFEGPLPQDVLTVKSLLFDSFNLPIEIIDTIIDFAEYWPHTTVVTNSSVHARGTFQDAFVIRSLPLGYLPGTFNYPLPIKDYLAGDCTPHENSEIDTIRAATSNLLAEWAKESLPRSEHPCRKIVFSTKSKDQGWGGQRERGSIYSGSYSWFDVGLERLEVNNMTSREVKGPIEGFDEKFRLNTNNGLSLACRFLPVLPTATKDQSNIWKFSHPYLPPPTKLQSNITAGRKVKEHIITWAFDDSIDPNSTAGEALERQGRGKESGTGSYVRDLKLGDIITVWARARFPGWMNTVEEVKIDIYWAV